MFKFFSLSCSILILGACAKDPKSVSDPGPNFSVSSLEIKMLSKGPNPTPIFRNDPLSGPQIQIMAPDYGSIKATERKLVCGSVTLQGAKALAGDATLFNFRLAEEEFPGLSKMPIVAKCELTVIATNNIGSTTTKTIPVTLTFDKNPALNITKQVADIGLNPYNADFEIKLEIYQVKNNFPYPVTINFTPARQVTVLTKIDQAPEIRKLSNPNYLYDMKLNISSSRIEVSGNPSEENGDLVHFVRLVLPPGNEITVTSFGKLPVEGSQRTCKLDTIMPSNEKFCRNIAGIYVALVREPNMSVSTPTGFEMSPEDFAKPNYLTFDNPVPTPVPGISQDPTVNKGQFGIN